jgi:predicted metal-dependent HD superfamily phosphohydrolase/GNAT superfamily N-acetyltransferase
MIGAVRPPCGFHNLMTCWNNLLGRNCFPVSAITGGWNLITERYMEPQRHYHTLVHLDELLTHFSTVEQEMGSNTFSDRDSVLFTLFFHDAVYDPHAKDNEEQSAVLFAQFSKNKLPAPTIEKVSSFILQTKSHLSVLESAPQDLLYFLDMDLAILGAPKERYIRYADEIRSEYKHVPHDLFAKGRSGVLRNFLGQRLFKTPFFRERLELRARVNLQWEIMRLKSPELAACRLTITDAPELKKLESSLRRDTLKLTDVDVGYCAVMNMDMSLCIKDRGDRIISYVLTTMVEDEHVPYSLKARELHEACGKHLLVHSVFTLPEQRHRGFATALMNQVIGIASERNMTRVTTWCPKELVGYFLALGFTQSREVLDVPCILTAPPPEKPEKGEKGEKIEKGSFAAGTGATFSPSVTVEMSLNLLGFKM